MARLDRIDIIPLDPLDSPPPPLLSSNIPTGIRNFFLRCIFIYPLQKLFVRGYLNRYDNRWNVSGCDLAMGLIAPTIKHTYMLDSALRIVDLKQRFLESMRSCVYIVEDTRGRREGEREREEGFERRPSSFVTKRSNYYLRNGRLKRAL